MLEDTLHTATGSLVPVADAGRELAAALAGSRVPYLLGTCPAECGDTLRRCVRDNARWDGTGRCSWALLDAAGEPVGLLLVKSRGNEGMLAYWVTPRARRQGHAGAALAAVAGWAAGRGLKRLLADTEDGETASARLLEAAGFGRTGSSGRHYLRELG